jgi:hypothetical protein
MNFVIPMLNLMIFNAQLLDFQCCNTLVMLTDCEDHYWRSNRLPATLLEDLLGLLSLWKPSSGRCRVMVDLSCPACYMVDSKICCWNCFRTCELLSWTSPKLHTCSVGRFWLNKFNSCFSRLLWTVKCVLCVEFSGAVIIGSICLYS